MEAYEQKRAKERDALDKKFKVQAGPLADRLIEEIEKATGVKAKKSVQDGSYAIFLMIDEPRITVEIEHDWGAGHGHWTRLPTGNPKINLDIGGYRSGGKSWYRPNKEGGFNVEKIIEKISQRVESYKQSQEWSRKREIEDRENSEAQAKEMEGIKFPEGVIIHRIPGGAYGIKFAGTFHVAGAKDAAALADLLNELVSKVKFEKSWRTDF
jgi:hypothetical protein